MKSRRHIAKQLLKQHLPKLAAEVPEVFQFLSSFLTPAELLELYALHKVMIQPSPRAIARICDTCGVLFFGADPRFCPVCHARAQKYGPLGESP